MPSPDLLALPPFRNQPFLDFALPENKRSMDVTAHLGREYDLVIGGKSLRTEGKILSANPARPAQIVSIHQMAEAEHIMAP